MNTIDLTPESLKTENGRSRVAEALREKEQADNTAKDMLCELLDNEEIRIAIRSVDPELVLEAEQVRADVRIADHNFLAAVSGK